MSALLPRKIVDVAATLILLQERLTVGFHYGVYSDVPSKDLRGGLFDSMMYTH